MWGFLLYFPHLFGCMSLSGFSPHPLLPNFYAYFLHSRHLIVEIVMLCQLMGRILSRYFAICFFNAHRGESTKHWWGWGKHIKMYEITFSEGYLLIGSKDLFTLLIFLEVEVLPEWRLSCFLHSVQLKIKWDSVKYFEVQII